MLRIHEELQQGSFPNCSRLAGEIEVSTRTIKRDIDFMKYRLDLPIEYHPQRYGYYYSEKVDRFPTLPITEAEIFACWWRTRPLPNIAERRLNTCSRRLSGS